MAVAYVASSLVVLAINADQLGAALEASGAEIVTVALRRVNLSDPDQPKLVDYIDPKKYTYLPT